MRSKDLDLKKAIYQQVNQWKQIWGYSPSLADLANELHVSRTTVYRYLKEMSEDGDLDYYGCGIDTREFNCKNMQLSPAKIVGSIPCGEAQNEEEYVEAYVPLPTAIFGKGEFYILRAQGDSMEDEGISEGDMVIVRRQETARPGDIVVALDDENRNTLKAFTGWDEEGYAILEYRNVAAYPGRIIRVRELKVQGVASKVLKNL